MSRHVPRLLLLTAGFVLASASAAAAHPGFRPDEVPAGGPVEVELVVPHGCGSEGEGGSPTVAVVAQLTDTFILDPLDTQGWTTLTDDDVAGWLDDGGATSGELLLPARVDVTGEPGDVIEVAVYQECEDGSSYRWQASEGEDGDPAVRLTIAEGTPPPLPEPTETATSTPTGAATTPTTAPTTAAPTPAATSTPSVPAEPSPSPTASPTATPTPSATPTALAADEDEGSGSNAGLVAAIAAAVVAVAGGAYAWNRRGDGDGGEA